MELSVPLHPYLRNSNYKIMKTLFSIIAFMLLTSMGQEAQVTITGKVTSLNGDPLTGVTVTVKETGNSTTTGPDGKYSITASPGAKTLLFSLKGMKPKEEPIIGRTVINIVMEPLKPEKKDEKAPVADQVVACEEVYIVTEMADAVSREHRAGYPSASYAKSSWHQPQPYQEENTESYAGLAENGYKDPLRDPYSTFSIDVDNASYSNVRRFINLGQKVPADAVRIEEMINYFKYDYPKATGEHPFSVYTEAGICPWNKGHYLLHVGLRGKDIDKNELPPSNLVFLIDVSGSMDYPNKLPLLKSAFGTARQ